MKQKKSTTQILAEAQKIRENLNLTCTQAENYLFYQYLELVNKPKFSICAGGNSAHASPEFRRAFATLTYEQKANHYLQSLLVIRELMSNIKEEKSTTICSQREVEKMKVYIREDKFLKEWYLATVEVNMNIQTIKISSLKSEIDLQCYIIRSSKSKKREAFALESIEKFCYPITIRFAPQNPAEFENLFDKFSRYCLTAMRQKFKRILKKSKISAPDKSIRRTIEFVDAPKTLEFANSNRQQSLRRSLTQSQNLQFSMEEYTRISENLVSPQLLNSLDEFEGYQEVRTGVFYHKKLNKVKKIFVLEDKSGIFWLAEQLFQFQKFKNWKKSLFMISFLAEFPQQKTKIFHQISMYKDGSEADFVYLRHFFNRGQVLYYIDKSISTLEYGSHQNSTSRGKINYCLWRLKAVQDEMIEIMVEAEMGHLDTKDIKAAIDEQIGQLSLIDPVGKRRNSDFSFQTDQFGQTKLETISNKNQPPSKYNTVKQMSELFNQMEDNDASSIYYSIVDSQSDDSLKGSFQKELKTKFVDLQKKESFKKRESKLCIQSQKLIRKQETSQALEKLKQKMRYQILPTLKEKPTQTPQGYKFFQESEWKCNQKGELINVNLQKIKAQSSVLSSVVKQLGKNFFSGKSILSICMPIQIFGTDSNLQRLCKAMAYGPIFLQTAAQTSNPLDRMINTFLFSLGCSLLYIEMSKPFNPILGQTYQGFIDGCPVYGQQISHHPPISAVFFQGRGYSVNAHLQAKVDMGMNSASGINEGYYEVILEGSNSKKNVMRFNGPPGQMSGLVYGQRKLSFIKKTQLISMKDRLFCQISWGKNKSKDQLAKFNDYFTGKIGKIKNNVDTTDFTKLKESDIEEVLGVLRGRWTQAVYFNDKPVFNINQIMPYSTVEEPHPLLSNCLFRNDMMLRKEMKFEQAQIVKEEMQILQRNDKKLRKQK